MTDERERMADIDGEVSKQETSRYTCTYGVVKVLTSQDA
jgi:hypothetical protein